MRPLPDLTYPRIPPLSVVLTLWLSIMPAGTVTQTADAPKAKRYHRGMQPISYARHRFPPEVIRHAVWLYLRFTLSYRDVE